MAFVETAFGALLSFLNWAGLLLSYLYSGAFTFLGVVNLTGLVVVEETTPATGLGGVVPFLHQWFVLSVR